MRGGGGLLVIVIGLLILWAVINGAGPCLGGAFACLFGAGSGGRSSTTVSNPLTAHATGGASITNQVTATYNG